MKLDGVSGSPLKNSKETSKLTWGAFDRRLLDAVVNPAFPLGLVPDNEAFLLIDVPTAPLSKSMELYSLVQKSTIESLQRSCASLHSAFTPTDQLDAGVHNSKPVLNRHLLVEPLKCITDSSSNNTVPAATQNSCLEMSGQAAVKSKESNNNSPASSATVSAASPAAAVAIAAVEQHASPAAASLACALPTIAVHSPVLSASEPITCDSETAVPTSSSGHQTTASATAAVEPATVDSSALASASGSASALNCPVSCALCLSSSSTLVPSACLCYSSLLNQLAVPELPPAPPSVSLGEHSNSIGAILSQNDSVDGLGRFDLSTLNHTPLENVPLQMSDAVLASIGVPCDVPALSVADDPSVLAIALTEASAMPALQIGGCCSFVPALSAPTLVSSESISPPPATVPHSQSTDSISKPLLQVASSDSGDQPTVASPQIFVQTTPVVPLPSPTISNASVPPPPQQQKPVLVHLRSERMKSLRHLLVFNPQSKRLQLDPIRLILTAQSQTSFGARDHRDEAGARSTRSSAQSCSKSSRTRQYSGAKTYSDYVYESPARRTSARGRPPTRTSPLCAEKDGDASRSNQTVDTTTATTTTTSSTTTSTCTAGSAAATFERVSSRATRANNRSACDSSQVSSKLAGRGAKRRTPNTSSDQINDRSL